MDIEMISETTKNSWKIRNPGKNNSVQKICIMLQKHWSSRKFDNETSQSSGRHGVQMQTLKNLKLLLYFVSNIEINGDEIIKFLNIEIFATKSSKSIIDNKTENHSVLIRLDRLQVPRFQGSELPNFRSSEVPKFRSSELPNFRSSEVPRFQGSKAPRVCSTGFLNDFDEDPLTARFHD